MRRKLWFSSTLIMLILLSGCIARQTNEVSSGSGFDLNAFLKNPLVMVIIGAVALWFAFKSSKH